jgi:hypothetical protein
MNDYEKALERMKELPNFKLGEEVSTPIGKGIIVSLEMPSNGLYLSPERATAVVWFSTETTPNGWVQKEFALNELYKVFKIDLKMKTADEAADIIKKAISDKQQINK